MGSDGHRRGISALNNRRGPLASRGIRTLVRCLEFGQRPDPLIGLLAYSPTVALPRFAGACAGGASCAAGSLGAGDFSHHDQHHDTAVKMKSSEMVRLLLELGADAHQGGIRTPMSMKSQ